MKKPQYKNLNFDTPEDFDQWLQATYHCTVEFQDMGQDLLKIWLAESGEILHANLQASIWNGCFANMTLLTEFTPINLQVGDEWVRYNGLVIEKITYRNDTKGATVVA